MALTFEVYGTPAPQGSKKAYAVNGKAHLVDDAKAIAPWRNSVTHDLIRAKRELEFFAPYTEAVLVKITFWLPRPAGRPKTIDVIPVVKPDNDKLQRSTLDGITAAGIWADDSLAAEIHARKRYAIGAHLDKIYDPTIHRQEPGATISFTLLGRAW